MMGDEGDRSALVPGAIHVAIVNYNTRVALDACIRSARSEGAARILVADNGSVDGSLEMVRADHPDVTAISLPHNPGYGAAADALIAESDAPYVVVLNADTELGRGALRALGNHLDANPRVGLGGPRLHDRNGDLMASCYPDPSLGGLLLAESGAHRLLRRRGLAGRDDLQSWAHDAVRSVPWVLGAALVIRRTAWAEVGGFDHRFFLYFEEVDLCRRLRDAGWTVDFIPSAVVAHQGGASTGQNAAAAQRNFYTSLARYHSLHEPSRSKAAGLRLSVIAIMTARLARDGLRATSAGGPRKAEMRSAGRGWATVMADAARGWPGTAEAPVPRARSDWKVLLAEPATSSPITLVILGRMLASEVETLRAHFGADAVLRSCPDGPVANVLVAKSGARPRLSAVAAALAPGGVAYLERSRRGPHLLVTSSREARTARRSGLTVAGEYWVVPTFDDPRRYVPLGSRAALRWYLGNLIVGRGLGRVVRAIGVRAPGVMPWLAAGYALVVLKPPGDPVPEVLGPRVLVAPDGAIDGNVLAITSGHDEGSRAVLLTFPSGPRAVGPAMTVKVSARPDMNETTVREQAILTDLRQRLPAEMASTLPRTVGTATWRGLAVGAETAFSGKLLAVSLRENELASRRIMDLHRVTDWLIEFHMATKAPQQTWTDAACEEWIRRPLARYLATVESSPPTRALFARVEARSAELIGRTLPFVRRHYDLGPWNIIDTNEGLGVVDWETSANRPIDGVGPALCDLLYFAKYWQHAVFGLEAVGDEMHTFHFGDDEPSGGAGPYSHAARAAIANYCSVMGVDDGFVPVLAVYCWVEQALNGTARRTMLGVATADDDRTAMYVIGLASMADDLFAAHPAGGPSVAPARRRVMFLTPFGVDENGDHGGSRSLARTIQVLGAAHDIALVSLVADGAPVTSPGVAAACTLVRRLDVPEVRLGVRRRARLVRAALAGQPSWSFDLTTPELDDAIRAIAEEFAPDFVHVEFTAMGGYLEHLADEGHRCVLGEHDPGVPAARDRLQRDRGGMRLFRLLELQAWVRAERRAIAASHAVMVFSNQDRDALAPLAGPTPIAVVPFGLELPLMALDPVGAPQPSIAFVGSFRHPPNAMAAERLVRRIMPRLWEVIPDLRLYLVGPDVEEIPPAADPRVTITGFVKDLAGLLDGVSVIVAPLETGGGMRVKVIEALAFGKAVVATRLAMAGLPGETADLAVLAGDDDEFVAVLIDVLRDPERRRDLGRRAREWAQDWLRPEIQRRRYESLWSVLDQPGLAPPGTRR